MTKEFMPIAKAMWEANNHVASVKIGLDNLGNIKIKSGEQFAEKFLNLAYALFSACELSLFNEFKRIFPSYMQLIALNERLDPLIGYHNHAFLMQHNLMATVFQFYQGSGRVDDVKEACKLLEIWTNRVPDKEKFQAENTKLVKLVELMEQKNHPYFTISFKLPLWLPLPDGTYEINTIAGVEAISVESFTDQSVSSRLGDRHFSNVEVKVKGFTSTSNYWLGPNLENEYRVPWNIQIALLVVNQVILNAKLLDASLRLVLASDNDIGTAITTQYDGDGEQFHFSISLGFGGLALVDCLSRQELGEKQANELSDRLMNHKLLLHEELYSQALIDRGNMNLIGAFYLLNSAAEAMIDYFVSLVAEIKGKSEVYGQFMKGNSYCLQCDFFKTSVSNAEPPRAAVPPSVFQQIKYLQEIDLLSSKEVRRLQGILAKVRNDSMRNELAHGRRNDIPMSVVDKAIHGVQELSNIFTALSQR